MAEGSANQMTKRYQVIKKLGEGGMATVFHAFDHVLERDVAIKVIKVGSDSASSTEHIIKRFEREVKTLAKLTHPNIVHIHDFGRFQEKPYLIMEYLPGGTLEDHLGKQTPYQKASQLLLPIAEALQYAHRQNILHRDVKPANILFNAEGHPFLTDFGIAKILRTDSTLPTTNLTQSGMGIGTPEYMAPEQWHGQFSQQSDIYALGIIYYEMVTGLKPFEAETPAAILMRQMMEDPPHPAEFVENLPPSVASFMLKILERDVEYRYATMEEVVSELRNLASETLVATPPYKTQSAMAAKKKDARNAVDTLEGESGTAANATKEAVKSNTVDKVAKGFGKVFQQVMISLVIIAIVLTIILVIGSVYVFGLFSRHAIQTAFYEDVYREETYRITQEKLNLDIDEQLMPFFEDIADDIDANLVYPDTLELTLYRNEDIYHLTTQIALKNGYPAFTVNSLNGKPLLFVRGILSAQLNRGMRNVLDEKGIFVNQITVNDEAIDYGVTPRIP
jgi:eukaryotic-like serine/threonine-protein kinase